MRVGEWIEVRSKEEILRTLDKNGRLEGMPFMPQMFEYCGKRFQVYKSAHKTCDHVYTVAGRSVGDAVHLNLRCDGQAYGGCQHKCLLFWKEAWLKPVRQDASAAATTSSAPGALEKSLRQPRCTEEDVWKATRRNGTLSKIDEHTEFSCQGTELPGFTTPLSWWNPTQYVKDVASGNVTLGEVIRGGLYVMLGRRFGRALPWLPKIYNAFQRLTGGLPTPVKRGKIPPDQPEPVANLNLQPGELVRVRSHEEILATINSRNTNRGLTFDNEMVPFCGGTFRVIGRAERFLDEKTGRLKSVKTPAIILEGTICHSRFSKCRMFCPRSIYGWWREIWLERVEEAGESDGVPVAAAAPRRDTGAKPRKALQPAQ